MFSVDDFLQFLKIEFAFFLIPLCTRARIKKLRVDFWFFYIFIFVTMIILFKMIVSLKIIMEAVKGRLQHRK